MGRARRIVPVAIVLVALAGCSSEPSSDADPVDPATISVASFNFSESQLLAEIYSQTLEAGGYPVTRSFDLGPRELLVPALAAGLIDVVPEYAGTAVQFLASGARWAGSRTRRDDRGPPRDAGRSPGAGPRCRPGAGRERLRGQPSHRRPLRFGDPQ